jgi:hypothetical protein
MHFSTKFWRETRSNRGPATRPGQGVAAPRRHERPRAARRPVPASTPCAAQGHPPAEACPFPMRRAPPRLIGVLPDRAVPARCAPLPPVCRRRPLYARRPRPPCHGRISAVMLSSGRSSPPLFKPRTLPSLCLHRCLPRHPRRCR